MNDNKKLNLLLAVFGSFVGIGLGLLGGYLAKDILFKPPAGSSFESTKDLRKAITEAEQVDPNKNATLRSLFNPHPSDEVIYVLKPNLNLKFQDAAVKTNSFGMRNEELPLEKQKNTYRIALLGDSFAFGWGVEYKQSFAYLIQEMLNQLTNGKPKVEVLNFGIPGYSTFQEVANYLEQGQKFNPDAVLLYFVDNDFGLPFFIRNFEHPEDLLGSRMIHQLKNDSDNGGKYHQFINAMDPNKHILKLYTDCKQKNIPLFVAINPNRKAVMMRDQLWSIKNTPEINLLWLRDELLQRVKSENIDIKTLTLPNDPHPSPKSHRILAEMMSNQIYGLSKFAQQDSMHH